MAGSAGASVAASAAGSYKKTCQLACDFSCAQDTHSRFGFFFLGCLLQKKMGHIMRRKNEKTYGGRGNLLSGRRLSSGSLGGGSGGRLGGGLNNLDFLSGSSNGGVGSRHYCKKCECELGTRVRRSMRRGQ